MDSMLRPQARKVMTACNRAVRSNRLRKLWFKYAAELMIIQISINGAADGVDDNITI